jgi:hypothetical protein
MSFLVQKGKIFLRLFSNLRGWRTNRKIVVIESDDWGSIRMPSPEIYEKCLKAGYRVDLNPYEHYDSLASQEDLTLLFDLLYTFKDKNGNYPVITANCVVANPDFKKIREDNYENYYYELITETFKRYPKHRNNFELWKQGLAEKVFFPQFHAREHLNVSLFMDALQKGDKDVHWGFGNEMPGSIRKSIGRNGNHFMEASLFHSISDKNKKLEIYLDGLELFEKLFGYQSESIIPPNYTWSNDYNVMVAKKGVQYIQGLRKMREPVPGQKPKFNHRFLGDVNKHNQISLVRNCFFEPTLIPNTDAVKQCLSDISIAFLMSKPAIISMHRVNFVGFIDPTNRDRNLNALGSLLSEIVKKWNDVEFFNSSQLGHIIRIN